MTKSANVLGCSTITFRAAPLTGALEPGAAPGGRTRPDAGHYSLELETHHIEDRERPARTAAARDLVAELLTELPADLITH